MANSYSEHKHYLVSDNDIKTRTYNEQQYRDFLKEHKGTYETVLWSGESQEGKGGPGFTRQMCEDHNTNLSDGEKPWMTNEMLLEEAGMLNKDGELNGAPKYTEGKNIQQDIVSCVCWDSASRATCDYAKGELHALIGANGRNESTLNNVEREYIARNGDVSGVDVITNDKSGINEKTGRFDERLATHDYRERHDMPFTSPINHYQAPDKSTSEIAQSVSDKLPNREGSSTDPSPSQNHDYKRGISP